MTPNELIMKAIFGILLPALVAGITWGLAWRIWNRQTSPLASGTWAGALAVGLAFIVGFLGTEGWPTLPPHTAIGWLVFIAIASIVISLIETALPRTVLIRFILWLPIVIAGVWVLTSTPRGTWKGTDYFLWSGFILAGTWLLLALEPIAERRPGASIPLALWLWCAGIAGSLAMTGSILYGHLAGILAAAMGAGLVAAWIKPSISFARGSVATLTTLALAFLICGYFYSDLPTSSALILAAAPLMLWLGELSIVTARKPWMAVITRTAFIALPVTLALLFAAWPMLFPPPAKPGAAPSAEDNFYK